MAQWQPQSDASVSQHPAYFGLHQQQQSRDYRGPAQAQNLQTNSNFDAYQTPATNARASSNAAILPTSPYVRQGGYPGDGDATMQDAEHYARAKQPSRSSHEQQLPYIGARTAAQYGPLEESVAARRYSPMDTFSPTSPHASGFRQQPQTPIASHSGAIHSNRQSPTRLNNHASVPQPYYSSPALSTSRPPHSQLLRIHSSGVDGTFSPTMSHLSTGYDQEYRSPRHVQSHSYDFPKRDAFPTFTAIRSLQDLQPKISAQPLFRRANPEGGFISPLQALTTHLPSTYRICNPNFKYESSRNPRRVLTKPSKGVKNDGFDNEECDYILYVNDILGSEETGHKNRYLILDVLGQGTFGQVVKCQNLRTQEVVAVKVIKNKTAYFNQSMMEVSVLDLLNSKLDKNDDHHLLRLKDTFIHRQHLCLVFELLSVNLYELIKQNQFRGLSTTLVRVFAQQLLNGLSLLNKARLIHCDLKPENILLKNLESPIIKIIDFGSACDERQTVYTYIQSRFYRSPEVLLGLPYSSAIDMWSLGCIVVELFLGLPLFPGSSEYNQVARITEMLGLPPTWMLEMGKQSGEFFEKVYDEYGRKTYRLKSMEQYSREHNKKEQPSKKYFQATTLPEIVKSYSMPRKNMKPADIEREMSNRAAFIDFVRGLLTINPLERWSPQQAKLHPFISQQPFTGPFVPPMNLRSNSSNKPPAPGVQQQLQAEAMSKQRAQAAQMQAQTAAQQAYANMQLGQYPQAHHHTQPPPIYSNIYSPSANVAQQGAPPPYPSQAGAYGHSIGMAPPTAGHLAAAAATAPYSSNQAPQNLYQQAAARAGRPRASTLDYQQNGIPPAIQRVASHLDPNAPIRLQPSPAYYPPPPDGALEPGSGGGRRKSTRPGAQGSHARNRDFIRNLEDRTLEEGFMNQSQWH